MSGYEAARVRLIEPSPSITISTAAKELRAAGEPVIDLSLGEPDFDTPPNVVEAAYAAMKRGETRYTPPDGTPTLKDAVLEKFQRENGLSFERANISCANGAKQVIFNALMATLEPGDEVICPAPYWGSYIDMTLLLGGAPKVIKCPIGDGFKLTPTALEPVITPQSRWLMLNSPSNPSGATYSTDELRALGAVIGRHPRLMVMSDEIYEQIYYADEPFASFAAACPELADQTVIVNGVAKAYAMTGWRIGYAAAPAALARVMGKIQSQSTSNPCSISQAAAIEALTGSQNFVTTARAEFQARRDQVISGLAAIPGVKIIEPTGAFYAFPNLGTFIGRRAPDGILMETDTDLATYLLREGKVAGVQGAAFGLSPYFRISFALSRANLSTAVERIHDALNALQ
ncbi:MAG: aminotransferase class I/II-fold pyridoxal phosphate-dependent enzyme [Alphaproteobacteria bacterium]|nr:aminotransferase class I/II-fold pyridoxal phosphate-dependent enzyme [Alphaproteobacteria bacterium]